jgi:signal transduction histidine kinase
MDERASVLIIDDEPGVQQSLRAILSTEYTVHTAGSGDQALALLKEVPVDVATLDLKMPGLGGIDVLEKIKAHDEDIEVLIVTGYGSLDTAVEGIRLRAFDYISKPFDVEVVRDLVRRAVARRRMGRRLKHATDDFFANLTHEFRTPLNVIMGYSEILRDDSAPALSDEQRRALDRIRSNSTDLLAYVEGLFLLGAIEGGEVPVTTEPVQVEPVLRQVVARHAGEAAAKEVQFTVHVPADLTVTTDGAKVAKLVDLLVENALRWTVRGEIRLAAEPDAARGVAIVVHDTGAGMEREEIEAVLALLAPANGAGRAPGSGVGLGLRIATAIARRLGGQLRLESAPGRGTEVRLALPARPPENTCPTPPRSGSRIGDG